ncbi:MAG TPA: hypothetical protein VID48_04015 [Solirubrobacteraceae bacterium]|jgi:hypothetical protein
MSAARDSQPEPNFARLVTKEDLDSIEISAHALRRFVDRLQPGIPGAARAAQVMGRLEEIPSGTRSQRERNQLREHRDWLRAHVEPCIRDLLTCEGFWATERPRWSQSRTPSDAHVQIGGLCYWPSARDHGQPGVTLTTCTNGRDITWDIALQRGYTRIPKPYMQRVPAQVRTPGWSELIGRAWRSRHEHSGLLRSLRTERAVAKDQARQKNERATADHQAAKDTYDVQWENAKRTFRERHT